jgi:phospholipid/cholesterol/gamma-HCH transport system substrate-binding protein
MRFDRPANHKASRVTILVAALAALVITGILVYLAAVAPRGVPTRGYVDVDAVLRETADLRLLSSVTINGRRVGQVSEINSDGELAHLNLQLEPGTELPVDSTARIRVKNPVGGKYVDIKSGAAEESIPDNGTLPVEQTSTSIDTPDLLATFDDRTRGNLGTGVQGLGRGFLGRGQGINTALPKAPQLLENTKAISDAILAIPGAAARFFPSAELLAAAYDPVRDDLREGFRPAADVFEAFAQRPDSVQGTLETAPPALTALRDGLNPSIPFLIELEGFARATSRLTVPLPNALREATSLLQAGGPALDDADPLIDALGDAVDPTLTALSDFRPEIDPTIRLVSQRRGLIALNTYSCDVKTQTQQWRSALAFGVPTNGDPTSELDYDQNLGGLNNSFRVLGVPPTTEALLADQLTVLPPGVAEGAYPEPCTANTVKVVP